MSEMYTNEIGKSRPNAPDAEEQSKLRQEWLQAFESRLKFRLPDSLQSVQLHIVGSVAKNQASSESDIDIVIKSAGSDPLAIPQIRREIFSLLKEMQDAGEITYKIEIQDVGNPLMFSQVAMLQRSRKN